MIARVAALGAVALAVVLLAVVLLGGGATHEYSLRFENAGQLVKGDEVQVGGRRVGTVKSISLTPDSQARIEVAVDEPYAPLHQGTEALIRATSLSGVANRYVALSPGAQNRPQLQDGDELDASHTTSIVDLDQLVNALDGPTRADLQKVIKGFATQLGGQGEAAGQAARYFNPVLSTSRDLVDQLTADEGVLTEFLLNASKATTALADRGGAITSAVSNTNATAAAIAAEDASLDRALEILPRTLRRGSSTFLNLRPALDDLTTLVDASKPATRDLAPFLRRLRPLVGAARPTIADLRRLVSRPGADNDLVEATLKFPPLETVAAPALRSGTQALKDSQKVVRFYRPYAPDLVGWLRDFGQGASNYDANGHFARIAPVANAFSFNANPAGGVLEGQPASARNDQLDVGNLERCPGAATQVTPDRSNLTADLLPPGACDPTQYPSGP